MTAKPRRARFIAFEGGEASGKSTQAALLAERLDAVLTREPGGTALGAKLRALLLDPAAGDIEPRAEVLLLAADRAQHVAQVVRPALDAGRHVVTDRFAGSSLAYQGFGRGLEVDDVARISRWAAGGVWPDLTVLIDIAVEVAAERLGSELDRFEAAGPGFHQRVRAGFLELAAADPEHWVVVDGSRSIDEVATAVRAAVEERLDLST